MVPDGEIPQEPAGRRGRSGNVEEAGRALRPYEAAIRAEHTRYNVLLAEQKGLPLNAEPDSFAKGSPTRATTTTAASGGNREELLGQRPAGRECKTLHEADAGSRNPDAVTATAVTERFSPESESSDPQKEAHSDAPAGQ